jgi:hypothetical protein
VTFVGLEEEIKRLEVQAGLRPPEDTLKAQRAKERQQSMSFLAMFGGNLKPADA